MSYCAPNVDISDHYTCFTMDELKEIALAFNIYIQTENVCSSSRRQQVCVSKKPIGIRGKNKKQLWTSIYKRLQKLCPYERCWLDFNFIDTIPDTNLRDKIKYFTYKPKISHGQNSWLSTIDINSVMQQYQELDKSFKFVGALPCDFYTKVKVHYDDVHKYKRVGFVFNLDTHDKPGSHWVAFLVDNTVKTCEYFDSAGDAPNRHIAYFIKKLMKLQLPNYTYLQNSIVHQKQNNECGVYALYFIIQRLLGKSFQQLSSNVIRDSSMNKFRNVVFRPA